MRMQPTFRVEINGPIDDAVKRMRGAVSQGDLGRHTKAVGSCLDLRVPPDEQRLWSPHLSVQLSPTAGEEGVELFGRFSPRPEVWTFVMLLYFASAFVAICGAVYGCVQSMMGATPWALLAVPLGAATILALHLVSLAGQRFSADQMVALRERLDRIVAEASLSPTRS